MGEQVAAGFIKKKSSGSDEIKGNILLSDDCRKAVKSGTLKTEYRNKSNLKYR